MPGKNQLKLWLVGACLIETLCATYLLNVPGAAGFFSILYFAAGLGIGLILLFLPAIKRLNAAWQKNSWPELLVKGLLVASMACFLIYGSRALLIENPLDYRTADMLPVIKTMDQRFLHGAWNQVYDNIPQIWNGSKPVYLPFMWLPFSPAVALDLDMRLVTIGALIIVFFILVMAFDLKKSKPFSFLLVFAGVLLFAWLVYGDERHGFISFSEEGLIVLYYAALSLALLSGNIVWISLTIILCMLSRYSCIGFVPAFFIYLLLSGKKNQAFLLASIGILGFLLFFILPFGWRSFTYILRLPGNYIGFSRIVWRDSPEVFMQGLGFARFFVPGRMNELHLLLISLSFAVPLSIIACWYLLKRKLALHNVPLATMKISLVVFYNFIDVPYLYLFYTSSVVSLIFAAGILRNDAS